MDNRKSNLPASVRIAFVVFVALGIIIIGFLWMSFNERKEKNEELSMVVDQYQELIEKKKGQLEATMDEEYLENYARENGYALPGEQFYPIEYEE